MSFYVGKLKIRLGKFPSIKKEYGRWMLGVSILHQGKMWIFHLFNYNLTLWYRQ